jgi:chromosome segregation ATPase
LLALLNNLLAGSTAGGTSVLGQTAASYTAGGAAVPGQAPAGYTAGSASVEGRVEISDALALDRSLGEQARSQLTQALPDVKDELADTFIGLAAEKEKRRSIEEEKRRLQTLVAEKKRLYEEAGEALKRAIDGAGDFDGAQREWRKAADDFQKAENDLKQFLEQYPGQAQDKAQQGKS